MNPKVKFFYWLVFAVALGCLVYLPTRAIVQRLDAIAAAQASHGAQPALLGALPSGNGPTDANHSLSTVPATDAGAWPISGTITVSGTDTANQGTANDGGSPWYVQSTQIAPATSIGTCANNSLTTTNATQFGSLVCVHGCRISTPIANTAPVYIGDSAVTVSTGTELTPGKAALFLYSNCNVLYARTGTATQAVHYCNE